MEEDEQAKLYMAMISTFWWVCEVTDGIPKLLDNCYNPAGA